MRLPLRELPGGIGEDRMGLMDAQVGQVVRVLGFRDETVSKKLYRMGLYPGDEVKMLRKAPLGGAVMVSAGGRELALGRGVAEKITVELV